MLEDVLKSYRKKADEICWKSYGPNELFFKYIEHEHDDKAEAYFAGIVCRFWGHSARMWLQCNKHIPFEYCYDCIIDAIKYVLKKRVWENPKSSLYKDPTGPDKAMHISMKRQKAIVLSKFNAKRRLSNFNTLSIDEAHENYNDSADGLLFGSSSGDDYMRIFISEYFDKGQYLEGLILDSICYSNDTYKESNIIKNLRELSEKDLDYFITNYDVDKIWYLKTLWEIKRMSRKMLSIKINSILYKIKKEGLFSQNG